MRLRVALIYEDETGGANGVRRKAEALAADAPLAHAGRVGLEEGKR